MAAEKVGIEIELMNADTAFRTLKEIESTVNSLGRKKTMIKLDDGSLVSVDERIKQIQDRLAALGAAKKTGVITPEETAEAKRLSAELQVIKRGLKEGTANAKTFAQVFNSISSKAAHIGSAMQSLGNSMTRLTSPFRRLTTGMLMGAGYKALNLFTEGLSNSFARADTMKNYDRALSALGLDTKQTFKVFKEAKTAKDNLDEAVQGLPTSLDEIMAAQKVYAGATGEMIDSTKTAIAANNAFLASGMGSREQRFMQKYLVAIASGAELTTTQWQSMARIAPLAMRAVSKELGYADNEYAQFTKDVQDGTIAGKEFLKAFQKVGISGAVADAARVQTESWAGLSSNIRIAVTRMGEGVIKTLNETFKDATGRTLLQRLLGIDANGKKMNDGIRDWINGISESVQNWIKSNPDRLVDFFNDIKDIDWKGLLKGIAEGMGEFAKLIGLFAKWASNKDMSQIGKWAMRLNVAGWGLSTLGGFIKGTRHIWGLLGAGGAKIGGKIAKIGIFGKIASFFGSGKGIKTAEKTAKTIPSVADTFKGAFSALSGLIKVAGAVTLVAGTGFVAFKSAKSILQDLKDMVDLVNGGGWDNVGYVAGGIVVAIGAFTEIFQAIGTALGPQGLLAVAIASVASFLVTGTFAGDMRLIKDGVISIRDTILELDNVANAITNMKGIGTLGDDVKEKFRTTIDAINEIKGMFDGKNGSPMDRGVVEQGLPSGLSMIGKVSGLEKIAQALGKMEAIVTQINKISGLTVKDASGVIADIKSQLKNLQGIRASSGLLKQSTKLADSLIQVRRIAYHINKLAATEVNTGGFATFVQNIKSALEELKAVQGELMLDIEVKLSPMFASSVQGVIKNIKAAKKDIQKYKAPISFNIPVSITFSVTSNALSAIAKIREDRRLVRQAKEGGMQQEYQATGGLIYRARGGGVPWKRRGTDTVPAMLTPGEFVHNKRAVSAFGIDFMRRVNNLDVKGAMNELMHRAGHMANVNRGATITNNYNNNQKVVINNNGGSGAGFTFKTASRFVGAF